MQTMVAFVCLLKRLSKSGDRVGHMAKTNCEHLGSQEQNLVVYS